MKQIVVNVGMLANWVKLVATERVLTWLQTNCIAVNVDLSVDWVKDVAMDNASIYNPNGMIVELVGTFVHPTNCVAVESAQNALAHPVSVRDL
jgi:hypothetical protein